MSAFEQRMQEYISMINEAAAQYVSAEAFKGRESEGRVCYAGRHVVFA